MHSEVNALLKTSILAYTAIIASCYILTLFALAGGEKKMPSNNILVSQRAIQIMNNIKYKTDTFKSCYKSKSAQICTPVHQITNAKSNVKFSLFSHDI